MNRHGSIVSRRDSVLRPPQLDVLPCEHVSTRHLHVLPSLSTPTERATRLTPEIDGWLHSLETTFSLETLPQDPKIAPAAGIYEVPTGLSVGTGQVLLRVGRSLMGWEDRNYQLLVRVGEDSVLSCPTGKAGSLQDYFLLNLKKLPLTATIDIFVCPVGNAIEQRLAAKVKSIKDRASELLKINRAHSRADSTPAEEPMVSIPIALLLQQQQLSSGGIRRLAACYYVRTMSPSGGLPGASSGSSVVGEISLDLISTHNAFIQTSPDAQSYQNYLTVQAGSHCWRRQWGLLLSTNLHFFDFQRHERPSTGFKNAIDLTRAVGIKHYAEHDCGLQNVVKVIFDDHSELLAYADDESNAVCWADAIHRAVWNQPYFVA